MNFLQNFILLFFLIQIFNGLIFYKKCDNYVYTLSKVYHSNYFLLMSLIISIKYNEDLIFDNKYYSEVAGVSIKEFNSLESEFLTIINFDLYIPDEEFFKYKFYLEKYTN